MITTLPEAERQAWAEKLAAWPNEMAGKLTENGFDGSAIFRDYIQFLTEDGYELPVAYQID